MNENENITQKICPKCGRELPLEAFNKKTDSPDGHQMYCRDCMKKMNNARNEAKRKERYGVYTAPKDVAPKPTPEATPKPTPAPAPKVEARPATIKAVSLSDFTPAALVSELRSRGYEVTCKKVVVEEL